ncbi:hypothetical protein [Natronohydrobacter thiooxidans]|nr:hypothetical protein [Natronohydrobacter thiooxidans]
MTKRPQHRWITAIVTEAADVPVLPWERAAKRARRLQLAARPGLAGFA